MEAPTLAGLPHGCGLWWRRRSQRLPTAADHGGREGGASRRGYTSGGMVGVHLAPRLRPAVEGVGGGACPSVVVEGKVGNEGEARRGRGGGVIPAARLAPAFLMATVEGDGGRQLAAGGGR
jgi:hypothetical protein